MDTNAPGSDENTAGAGPGAPAAPPADQPAAQPAPVGFAAVLRYFLRLGALGFGGPIAVVGYMQRDLVEQRGWIAKHDFLDGAALCQTMPGPLTAHGSIWVCYLTRCPLA